MAQGKKRITKKRVLLGVFLFIFLFTFAFLFYAKNYGGNHIFDMKEVNGVADNNPYGIRNDVYTKAIEILDREAIKDPDFKQEKYRNLYFNLIKSQLVSIKHFSYESKAVEANSQGALIMNCFFKNNKEQFISDQIRTIPLGEIQKVILKSNDLELIWQVINSYSYSKSAEKQLILSKQKWVCDKYEGSILDEKYFLIQDKREFE